MKKLKKFQKFALTAKQASMVKGGLNCLTEAGEESGELSDHDAVAWCQRTAGCVGCF